MKPTLLRALLVFAALALTGLQAAPADHPAVAVATKQDLSSLHYKVVLVAGDRSTAAFDHATEAMDERLLARGTTSDDIMRLSADPAAVSPDVPPSTLRNVLAAIAGMHPAPGQGCFVFATSHGAYHAGLVLVPSENVLSPAALDAALSRGCGNAPTVVIVSACFSGTFTQPPMARPNRIVLTAAREDRPSFGCGAGFDYTVYDRCLLQAVDQSGTWRGAYAAIRGCVAAKEHELGFRASEPQAWFGPPLVTLPVPARQ